jgi:ELWxxDGT repeat protein
MESAEGMMGNKNETNFTRMYKSILAFLLTACLGDLPFADAQAVPSTLVKDVSLGAGDGITRTGLTEQIGSTVYFVGSDVGIDEYLFKTGGTPGSTVKVHPGIKTIVGMAVAGNTLVFEATQNGKGLFKSDGTQAGTVKLADFGTEDLFYLQSFFDDRAIFGVRVNGVKQLWITDGTLSGTFSLGDWEIHHSASLFTRFQDKMIITDQFNPDPLPIVATDGTVAGTYHLDSTLLALTGLADIYNCVGAEDLLFVSGKNVLPNGTYNGKTFVTDGTPAGTHEINTFGTVDNGLKVSNQYYLFVNDDVYVYNSTTQTTTQIMNGTAHVFARPLAFYGKAYISGENGDLYESDGTVEGTKIISTAGAGTPNYNLLIWEFDHMLYYNFRNPQTGVGIYRIDLFTKTESLFVQFSDYSNVVRVPNLHKTGCKFIFPRHTVAQGYEWWSTPAVPAPPLVMTGDSSALCTDQPVPLEVVNVCAGCTVNWNNGQTGPGIAAAPPGSYYSSMSNSCGTGPWSNVVNIASTPPSAPTVMAIGSTTLCSGDSVLLLTGNVCSGCTFAWSNGQTGNAIWVSAPGEYTVAQTNVCGTSTPSNALAVVVNNSPTLPDITVSGDLSLCPGETLVLSVSNTCNGCTVFWSNGQIGDSLAVTAPGAYGATMSNDCGASGFSDGIIVQEGDFTPSILVENGCSFSAPAGSNYQWYLDNQAIAGANGSMYVAEANGLYSVGMTSPDGCTGTSEPVFANCLTGTEENPHFGSVRIFPNPAREKVHFAVSLATPTALTFHIASSDGRIIHHHLAQTADGNNVSATFDTSPLPAGIYSLLVYPVHSGRQVHSQTFEVLR